MTQKELLYVEDAIGHESIIIDVINDTIDKLEDEELVEFMENEEEKHTKMKEELIGLLEGLSNE